MTPEAAIERFRSQATERLLGAGIDIAESLLRAVALELLLEIRMTGSSLQVEDRRTRARAEKLPALP